MARMTASEKAGRKAERARQAARMAEVRERNAALLAVIREAIREGRAYLDTFLGRMEVKSYNHDTGWAVTNRPGSTSPYSQHSFMICIDAIKFGAV
jgi:hypothetical protein